MPGGRRYLEVNSDAWKSFFHARLKTPVDKPGAMTLYDPGIETGHASEVRQARDERNARSRSSSPARGR
jgi:hypothetical protein